MSQPAARPHLRRRAATLVAVVLVLTYQAVLLSGYQSFRTTWHYLVHSAIGFGLGLAGAALVAAARRRRTRPVLWALAGQLVSVLPDVLFRMLRMPHTRAMDVFVGHVTVHVSPAPLLVAVVVAITGSWSWWLAACAHRRGAAVALTVLTVAVLGSALALHTPLPTRLVDYQTRFGD